MESNKGLFFVAPMILWVYQTDASNDFMKS